MLTIVLTHRNRDFDIVKKCFESLNEQTVKNFSVCLVDYGSNEDYRIPFEKLVKNYSFISYIHCPVQGQLWSKCRAINIALKKCTTDFFMVGDIDLIFHPDFVKKTLAKASDKIIYFQYAFLSKEESKKNKKFEDYKIDFLGNEQVTGTTMFPTKKLLKVNGYDEFYHGWGAEDTDIHIRLNQAGLEIEFYDEEILVKHQWHPKAYRSKDSTSPYHSALERINHDYMNYSEQNKRTKVNLDHEWGLIPDKKEYLKLNEKPDFLIKSTTRYMDFVALLAQLNNFKDEVVTIKITNASFLNLIKQRVKKTLGKKHDNYLSLEETNNLLLEEIIKNHRNSPYIYSYNRKQGIINLTIYFN